MKYIVTGGLGFIGSNLVDKLISHSHEVHVIDDLSFGKEEYKNSQATYYIEDFTNISSINIKNIDAIFHLGACARIQPSFEDPVYTIKNNIYGSSLVAEFAKNQDAKVVYAGSSTADNDVLINPYAFGKHAGEDVFRMFSKCYKLRTATTRFYNVYGPRNPLIGEFSPVVVKFEEQYKAGEKLTVVGTGEQRRDFTHVDDICEGLIAASSKDFYGDIFNLGTGTNYSINELARMFVTDDMISYIPAPPGEADTTLADYSHTEEATGWKARIRLPDYVNNFLNETI